MKILVADDSPTIRRLLTARLDADGHELLEATDGQEALELAASERPDLIVLDRQMPKMDGIEVTRRLRERPETESVLVLMLTNMNGERDMVEGIERGVDDYVAKPFSPRELSARIGMLLARRPLAAAA